MAEEEAELVYAEDEELELEELLDDDDEDGVLYRCLDDD